MEARDLLRHVRRRPGMYLGQSELPYDKLVAFVLGMDQGTDGALLDGFREFLVLKLDNGSNLAWESLVLHLSTGGTPARPLDPAQDQAAVACLFDLLDEFLVEVANRRRRTRIHHEYLLWLQSQSWYDLNLERFGTSAPPQMVNLDQACTLLNMPRTTIFDLVASAQLQPMRDGATLLFRKDQVEQLAASSR